MSTVDVLKQAKALISAKGWGQGYEETVINKSCHCVATAIAAASVSREKSIELSHQTFAKANGLNNTLGKGGIIDWNDEPQRTPDEIRAAFDKAIALAEQESA